MKVVNERDPVLNKIIEIASAGYDDGLVGRCWDARRSAAVDRDCGDTLALFVAREIGDACEGEDLVEGLETAARAMSGAAYQMEELAAHLETEARRLAIEQEGGPSSNSP